MGKGKRYKKAGMSHAADVFLSVILVICIGVFFFSGSYIGLTFYEQEKIDSQTKSLSIIAGVPSTGNNSYDLGDIVGDDSVDEPQTDENTGKRPDIVEIPVSSVNIADIPYLNADVDAVKAKNSDTVGWIYLCGPSYLRGIPVSAPLMHCDSNNYYLKHDFNGKSNVNGCIFVDAQNSGNILANRNTVIYAHARSYSRFGGLKNLASKYWYKDGNNHFIKISTPNGETVWQIFSYYYAKAETDYRRTVFSSDAEFVSYCNELQSRNILSALGEFKFSANDKIITLSTCRTANGYTRIAVHAVLVKSTNG